MEPPDLLLRNERGMHHRDGALRRAPRSELHRENGDAEKSEANEVEEDEPPSAGLAGNVRKAPDVAEPYRAPGGEENETDPTGQLLSHGGKSYFSPP